MLAVGFRGRVGFGFIWILASFKFSPLEEILQYASNLACALVQITLARMLIQASAPFSLQGRISSAMLMKNIVKQPALLKAANTVVFV